MNKKKILYLGFMIIMSICAFLGTRGGTDKSVEAEVLEKTNINTTAITFTDNKTFVIWGDHELAAYEYTGDGIVPQIEVKDGDKTLAQGTDYTVDVDNNVEVDCKGLMAVKGTGGYNGTAYREFAIIKANLQNMNMTFMESGGTFVIPKGETDLSNETVIIDVLIENSIGNTLNPETDYDLVCIKNNDGTGTVTATGKGNNYEGSKSLNFTYVKEEELGAEVKAFSPKLTKVTLSRDQDGNTDYCSMEIKDNKYTSMTADYEKFVFVKTPYKNKNGTVVNNCTLGTEVIDGVTYGVAELMTSPSKESFNGNETLYAGDMGKYLPAAGETVWVGAQQNVPIGEGCYLTKISNLVEVQVPEAGGNVTVAVESSTTDLSSCKMSFVNNSTAYIIPEGKSVVEPEVFITNSSGETLKEGTDYTLTYTNNYKSGTGKVTATGKGLYEGAISLTFTVVKNDTNPGAGGNQTQYKNDTEKTDVTNNTKPIIKPVNNNTQPIIRPVNNQTDSIVDNNTHQTDLVTNTTAPIEYNIGNCTITLSKIVQNYNGKAFKPTVTVKYGKTTLKKGEDFTVTYDKSKKIGTKKIKIKGKGKWKGEVEKKVKIVKGPNKITTSPKKTKYKLKNLKKAKKKTFKLKATAKENAKTTIKITKIPKKAKKYIKVGKNGKITVKKGLEKGKYVIKYKATSKATKHYKKTTVTRQVTIVIK